jgi:DMSO/TMAO reductase YedYZ molybdopterin-dependent catalytic subunit
VKLRSQSLIEANKDVSWFLFASTLGVVVTGYTMTFLVSDNALLRTFHFILIFAFTLSFALHVYISTFVLGYDWIGRFKAMFRPHSTYMTLRVIQMVSGLFLIVFSGLQLVSGLDWFRLGLGALLPYLIHRENDLYLVVVLSIHMGAGIRFWMIRGRGKVRLHEEEKVNLERRESIIAMATASLGILGALIFNNPTQVGTGNSSPSGVLPPGQTEIEQLKVLHTGIGIPPFDKETWRFEVTGLVENTLSLSYDEFLALPMVIRIADFHCVTGWTKFDNKWEGVSFQAIKEMVKPLDNARYVTFDAQRSYTTSLAIPDLSRQDVMLAVRLDDRILPREHGGPLRLIVPQKYGYKSAKWVYRLKFTEEQELGYWETRGYSDSANPFNNDRYSD